MENNIKGKICMGTDITIFLTKNELKELKNRKLEGILIHERDNTKENLKFPLLVGILNHNKEYNPTSLFSLDLLSKAKVYYDGVSITTPNDESPIKYEIKISDDVYDTLEKEGLFETIYIREEKFRIEITS